MKRIITLMLAAVICLGASTAAHALDVEHKGEMANVFGFNNDISFTDEDADNFFARSRMRGQVDFIASESLRGVFNYQIGTINWGENASGGGVGTDGNNMVTRQLYVDWTVPSTDVNVRMGIQHFGLPSATFGNPIYDDRAGGINVSMKPSDNFGLNVFWMRLLSNTSAGVDVDSNDADLFGVSTTLNFDSFNISPWAIYARVGGSSGYDAHDHFTMPYSESADENANVFAAGAAFEVTPTDALSIKADAMLSSVSRAKSGDDKAFGYMVNFAVDYEMPWGTPGVFGWYASGDDADDAADGEFGNMVSLGNDGAFYPTRLGGAGSYSCGTDSLITATGFGTAGVGLQVAGMSFAEDLSHTARVAYIMGTNDKDMGSNYADQYLTTKDKAIEINFDTEYKVYENLTAVLELGAIIPDFENDDYDKTAWNAQLIMMYEF